MKAAPFSLARAETVEEAVELLGRADGQAKCLAGGQSLVPMLAMRIARPTLLVDLSGVGSLAYVRTEGDHLEIGGMTRQRFVERTPTVRRYAPLFSEAVTQIGHASIRNRGTIGGSAAHADAAAEIPSALLTLDADVVVQGPRGARVIAASAFFSGFMQTVLDPDEVLTAVRIPRQSPLDRHCVLEFARRKGDFAVCGLFVAGRLENGRIVDPRVTVSGVTSTPARLPAVERLIDGQAPTEALFAEAAELPLPFDWVRSDVHGSAEYRRSLVKVLSRRALLSAFADEEE